MGVKGFRCLGRKSELRLARIGETVAKVHGDRHWREVVIG